MLPCPAAAANQITKCLFCWVFCPLLKVEMYESFFLIIFVLLTNQENAILITVNYFGFLDGVIQTKLFNTK